MCDPAEGRTREGRGEKQAPEEVVRFGTYNIRSRKNGGLESALCWLALVQVDCGMLQENQTYQRSLHVGVQRLLDENDGGTEPSSWRRCSLLPQGGALRH